jgi:hypothetical protein
MNARRVVSTILALIAIGAFVRAEVRLVDQGHKLAHDDQVAAAISREVKTLLADQTANRVKNVGTWCGAINGLEDVLAAYVSRIQGAPPLPVQLLDCAALERGTAASTSPETPSTPVTHLQPDVFGPGLPATPLTSR